MLDIALLAAVDAAFNETARGLAAWPDPHPNRSPLEEEYSRVSDPQKWRIIGARADAWLVALVAAGLATVERDASVEWQNKPHALISRVDRIVPVVVGALPVVVAHGRIEDVDDAGVTIGVGDPAIRVGWLPHCGCDACDSGSQEELRQVDEWVGGIVSGTFRRLSRGDREITVFNSRSWFASGSFRHNKVEKILESPRGWDEISGRSWVCP